MLYLSRAIINAKWEYYRLLNAVTQDGDWEVWLLFTLGAVAGTLTATLQHYPAAINSDI